MNPQDQDGIISGIPGPEGQDLFVRRWLPDRQPRGAILIAHGLGEHSGRYGNLINHLLPKGFALYGFDQPGHGKSPGTPGFAASIEQLLAPLTAMTDRLHREHPKVPLFIFSHSMGGLLTLRVLLDHSPSLQGAILSSPSLSTPESASSLTIAIGQLLSKLFPKMPLSELDLDQLSTDPSVVSAYREDPLVFHGKYSARLAIELLNSIAELKNRPSLEIQTPLLVLAGGEDRIAFVEDTRAVLDIIQAPDKKFILYPTLRHELINEPERERVLEDINSWLERRI